MTTRNDGAWLGDILLGMGAALVLILLASIPAKASDIDNAETSATSFCMRKANECPLAVPLAFATEAQRPLLTAVLRTVEAATTWTSDSTHYGRGDWWALIRDGKGDCEDYALTERRDLHAAGVPLGAMRLVEVEMQDTTKHMVLEVRFADGENMLLDNTWSEPYPARENVYWPDAASAWGSLYGWRSTKGEN